MNLSALAAQIEPDREDLADALRIAAPVVVHVCRDWPHLREDVEAEVAAALAVSEHSGDELRRRAPGIARNAAAKALDELARPVKVPSVNRRRAEKAVRLAEEEGLPLADAADAAGTDARTVLAILPAAQASYLAADALAFLADGGRTSPLPLPVSFIDAAERLERAALDALDEVYRETWYAVSGQDPFEDVEPEPLPGLRLHEDDDAPANVARPICTACFESFARPDGSSLCPACAPRRRPSPTPRTQQEAAEELGVTQPTVSRRLERIRQTVAAADA